MSNQLIACLIVLQASCNPGGSDSLHGTITAEQLLTEITMGWHQATTRFRYT